MLKHLIKRHKGTACCLFSKLLKAKRIPKKKLVKRMFEYNKHIKGEKYGNPEVLNKESRKTKTKTKIKTKTKTKTKK